MEFDEIVVKESPGLCRCCLSEGCYKDLGSEYSWMSETEIYADMLLECFDISISQHPTGPNGSNRLICEVCITRLRDACNFKKQVLESEKKFVDMIGRGEFRPKVLLYQQMKSELTADLDEDTAADDTEVEYLEDDPDYVDEDLLKTEELAEASVSEDITVSTLPVKGKRGRPRKNAVKPEKKAKLPKLEEKPRTSKAVAKGSKNDWRMALIRQQKREYLAAKQRNVEAILLYTTATPFIWHQGRYFCFFCKFSSKYAKEILGHVELHDCVDLPLAIKKYLNYRGNREGAIKVEVSDIICKLCTENVINLEESIKHLVKNHNINYDLHVENCLLPFRLRGTPTCGTCNMEHGLFEYLLRHANKQHLNHSYVCDICGKSFFSKRYFDSHHTRFHKEGGYKCDHCDEVLPTEQQRLMHLQKAHSINLVKCQFCGEKFKSTYLKNVHLSKVHGIAERRIKCPHCPKIFPQDNIMMRHVKRMHLKQRDYACDLCDEKFLESYDLKIHMMMHNGERNHCCDTCGKVFLKKSSLERHMQGHLKRETIY